MKWKRSKKAAQEAKAKAAADRRARQQQQQQQQTSSEDRNRPQQTETVPESADEVSTCDEINYFVTMLQNQLCMRMVSPNVDEMRLTMFEHCAGGHFAISQHSACLLYVQLIL